MSTPKGRDLAARQTELLAELKGLYALEWGELVLIFGGTPEISAVGRSRK